MIQTEFNSDITIVRGMDFRHTDPKIILPLGCKVSFDLVKKEVGLLETPFINK